MDEQAEQFTMELLTEMLQNPHIWLEAIMATYQLKADHKKTQRARCSSGGRAGVAEVTETEVAVKQ